MLVAVQCTDAEFANFHYYFILVSKFDLGLLNAYKLIYFDRNINGNKDEKILEDDNIFSAISFNYEISTHFASLKTCYRKENTRA